MTEAEANQFLRKPIKLVRMGSFTEVFRDTNLIAQLGGLAELRGYIGAQSAAILAETNDQVGSFEIASRYANIKVGGDQITALKEELRRNRPDQRIVRAHAWLLLQCAVSEFRRQGGHGHALELLTTGIGLISMDSGQAIGSRHIQSLFYFWRARVLSTALFSFRRADKDFERALTIADKTLDEKLAEPDRDRETELAAGAYVMFTILSFGLAQARQFESKLEASLWFLRAAIPISRGTEDVHRRGFGHLLMGTGLRGIGQVEEAEEQLTIAKRLLESPVGHQLHLARVHHQLSLCKYNRVPAGVARTPQHTTLLEEALDENRRASKLSGHDAYKDFRDPLLEFGLRVGRSLILTGLARFKEAHDLADEAISTNGSDVPPGTHGWALVAKGMALAEQAEHGARESQIRRAAEALQVVVENPKLRPTDRAAAHLHLSRLYSKVGQESKAAIHYERALPLVRRSEHGWLKDLKETTKASLVIDTGADLRANIEDLLSAGKEYEKGPWRYMSGRLELDLKRRLLSRIQYQELLKEQDGETKLAIALGLTRATLFAWKRDKDLKDFFPRKPRRGKV